MLAEIDAEINATVVRCSCWGGYRVKGIEYDTGGCMEHKHALAVAREMSRLGGPDEWLRRHRRRRWVQIQEVRRHRFRCGDLSVVRKPDRESPHAFVYVQREPADGGPDE